MNPVLPSPDPKRILVRGVNWLGDAVMSTPAVRIIKKGRPDARLTVLVKAKLADYWRRFPEIDLAQNKVGIFGKVCKLGQGLRPGDRVEIYRPLITDPKESRRSRAAKHSA